MTSIGAAAKTPRPAPATLRTRRKSTRGQRPAASSAAQPTASDDGTDPKGRAADTGGGNAQRSTDRRSASRAKMGRAAKRHPVSA